jgi:hypothetical protein
VPPSGVRYINLQPSTFCLLSRLLSYTLGCARVTQITCLVTGIVHKIGFKHKWENQGTLSASGLVTALTNKLNDNYALYCKYEDIKDDTKPNGGKLRVYNTIKCNFKMEKYLLFNGDRSNIQCITRLRISAHRLRIERGRYGKNPRLHAQLICLHCQ